METEGYKFDQVTLDPVGQLQWVFSSTFEGAEGSFDEEAANECQKAYDSVEQTYVFTHEQEMDPQLLGALISCLEAQGMDYPPDARNIEDFFPDGAPANIQDTPEVRCLNQEAFRIFPDLPQVGVGF